MLALYDRFFIIGRNSADITSFHRIKSSFVIFLFVFETQALNLQTLSHLQSFEPLVIGIDEPRTRWKTHEEKTPDVNIRIFIRPLIHMCIKAKI